MVYMPVSCTFCSSEAQHRRYTTRKWRRACIVSCPSIAYMRGCRAQDAAGVFTSDGTSGDKVRVLACPIQRLTRWLFRYKDPKAAAAMVVQVILRARSEMCTSPPRKLPGV